MREGGVFSPAATRLLACGPSRRQRIRSGVRAPLGARWALAVSGDWASPGGGEARPFPPEDSPALVLNHSLCQASLTGSAFSSLELGPEPDAPLYLRQRGCGGLPEETASRSQ